MGVRRIDLRDLDVRKRIESLLGATGGTILVA